jgi:inhibitor of growth protein 3
MPPTATAHGSNRPQSPSAQPFLQTPAISPLVHEVVDQFSSLPNELTRSFSDLRELDAVLRSSIEAITRKILTLTELIENNAITPSQRLVLILEIADDAQRLKMGSEDKIRVAGKACEEIVHSQNTITSLLTQLAYHDPAFNQTLSIRRTNYPHVAPSSLIAPTHYEGPNGRRRRIPGGATGGAVNGVSITNGTTSANGGRGSDAHSPVKRRRVDDTAPPGGRTPKAKEKERERLLEKQEREARTGGAKGNKKTAEPTFPDALCTLHQLQRHASQQLPRQHLES